MLTHEEYVERTLLGRSSRYIPVPEPYWDGELLVKGAFVTATGLRGFGTWTDGISRHSRMLDLKVAPEWLVEEGRRIWLAARTASSKLSPEEMKHHFEKVVEEEAAPGVELPPVGPMEPVGLDELPAAARRMAVNAHQSGWEVRTAKSRGHAGVRPVRAIRSIQVAAKSPDGEVVRSIWIADAEKDNWKRAYNVAGYGSGRKVPARDVDHAVG